MLSASTASAVIVHDRTPEETLRAARAVAETSPGTEILVVDNASGDGIGPALAHAVRTRRVRYRAALQRPAVNR